MTLIINKFSNVTNKNGDYHGLSTGLRLSASAGFTSHENPQGAWYSLNLKRLKQQNWKIIHPRAPAPETENTVYLQ